MAEAAVKKTDTYIGTGRRKTAVARIRIKQGKGGFIVNKKPMKEFFTREQDQKDVQSPLAAAKMLGKFDVTARVNGGGPTGQAGAVVLGIARALLKFDPSFKEPLQDGGYLTRDSRMKERKKPGQRGARAKFQFSKR